MKLKQGLAAGVAALCLSGVGFWFGNASAATNDPGSSTDPLVSKTYVDQLVSRLAEKSYIDERTAGLAGKSYVDQQVAGLADKAYVEQRVAAAADKAYVDSRAAFQVVNLPRGSAIIGQSGTELVLRGGKATAITSNLGGLFDATGASDVAQGETVKANHLLVVPRADGRGLRATADAILMVKGNYTVQTDTQ